VLFRSKGGDYAPATAERFSRASDVLPTGQLPLVPPTTGSGAATAKAEGERA